MVEVIKVDTTNKAAQLLANTISNELAQGGEVVWLVSGGSSIPIAAKASKLLGSEYRNRLRVFLVDDQYVPKGDARSNGTQLIASGFELTACVFEEILNNKTLEDTASDFAAKLQHCVDHADFTIGQFGIGAGYHTGGVQPGSIAAIEQNRLAVGYQDGAVGRITVTPALIKKLDVAFINSFGLSKRQLVEHFCISEADIVSEPTQSLKTAKKTLLCSDIAVD